MTSLPYRSIHQIVSGYQHGRTIGFPTLNFEVPPEGLPIEPGVYAGFVTVGTQPVQASFYYGPRHALKDNALSFEAYLLDTETIPATESALVWVEIFLRSVIDFGDQESLKRQIADDVRQTRRALRPWTEVE